MPDNHLETQGGDPSRRQFIRGASAVVAGGALLGVNERIARAANVAGSDEIKIALIGCGGRGSGAAEQALATQGKVKLIAMADAFADRVSGTLRYLKGRLEQGQLEKNPLWADSAIDVPSERQFVGFDAYQKCIDAGADVLLLCTPPGFRPIHFEAAVKAGKHIFMEKPVAVDGPGVRRVLVANEEAKLKNLMVAVGLQRRHDPRYIEAVERLQGGAIGDIVCTRVYWNGGTLWHKPREAQQTEMEYQMRNWYYFNWLCGDHIVEQHIHNMDVGNWLRGDKLPVSAQGMGGRQVRTGKEFGQIFDHHAVEFTYDDGTKMFSQCRHMDGCAGAVSEHAHGSLGTADLDDGPIGPVINVKGQDRWRSKARKVDNHHQEHHDLFAALRRGEVYNEGDYGAHSTMTAVLGRMATYSGKLVTWEEGLNSTLDLSPKKYAFDADPPVMPNEDGFYPVPVPGKTDVLKG
jgi:predicted dehydrogenase